MGRISMKRLFLFFILVTRNWIMDREQFKSSWARFMLTLTITSYLTGAVINSVIIIDGSLKRILEFDRGLSISMVFVTLAILFIVPAIYTYKRFPDNLIAEKINQKGYNTKYNRGINHIIALAFIVVGFIFVFFLPKWLS